MLFQVIFLKGDLKAFWVHIEQENFRTEKSEIGIVEGIVGIVWWRLRWKVLPIMQVLHP
jgi:hypothetical protein